MRPLWTSSSYRLPFVICPSANFRLPNPPSCSLCVFGLFTQGCPLMWFITSLSFWVFCSFELTQKTHVCWHPLPRFLWLCLGGLSPMWSLTCPPFSIVPQITAGRHTRKSMWPRWKSVSPPSASGRTPSMWTLYALLGTGATSSKVSIRWADLCEVGAGSNFWGENPCSALSGCVTPYLWAQWMHSDNNMQLLLFFFFFPFSFFFMQLFLTLKN